MMQTTIRAGLTVALGVMAALLLALLTATLMARPAQAAVLAEEDCPPAVQLGISAVCAISSVGERDSFTLNATQNEKLIVRMRRTAGDFYPQIQLLDNNGARVTGCYDAGQTFAGFVCTAPMDGAYKVEVGDYYNTKTGTYQLYVQSLSNVGNSQSISYGQLISGELTVPIENDVFRFTAAINEKVILRLRRTAGDFYPTMTVYNQAGEQLCYDAGQPLATLTCTINASGTFSIFINDYYLAKTGDYQLFIERLGLAAGAQEIEIGRSYDGEINTSIVMNTYRFSAQQNDLILLRAQRSVGNMYVRMGVYDSDGDRICYDDGQPLAILEPCTINAADQYTIYIDDYYLASTGEYTLHTQRLNGPSVVSPIRFGQTISEAVDPVASLDTYAFEAKTRDAVLLTLTRTAGAFYPRLRIFNPNGVRVCYADGNPIARILNCTLEDTGTYTVIVDDYYVRSSGTYTLKLACDGTGCGPAATAQRVYLPLITRR